MKTAWTLPRLRERVGSPADFYRQLEPDKIAEHILATSRGEIRELVERILEREHPQLWRETPPRVREAVHARVQEQLPGIVHAVSVALAERRVNITGLETRLAGASDAPLYVMIIEVAMPEGSELDLEAALSQVADQAEVEVSLRPLAQDAL